MLAESVPTAAFELVPALRVRLASLLMIVAAQMGSLDEFALLSVLALQ